MADEYIEYSPGLNTRKSWELYQRATKIIPGGASSHCRCNPIFDPYPLEFVKGEGVKLTDRDGNQYIDFAAGISALNIGHCNDEVVLAIKEQADRYLHTCSHVLMYEPYIRLVIIIGFVTLFTGLSALVFRNKTLKERYNL